jgi:hypothetical protein
MSVKVKQALDKTRTHDCILLKVYVAKWSMVGG